MTLTASIAFAFTSDTPTPTSTDPSILDLFRPVYEAFTSHQYALMTSALIVLVVAALRRYFGDKIPWLHTDAGGSALVFIGSAATASTAALAVPGAHFTLDLFRNAIMIGLTAAGGYAAIKNLIVEPILKPLAAKWPSLSWLFDVVTWIFDHEGSSGTDAANKADAAGAAAVASKPAQGATAVLGAPVQLA